MTIQNQSEHHTIYDLSHIGTSTNLQVSLDLDFDVWLLQESGFPVAPEIEALAARFDHVFIATNPPIPKVSCLSIDLCCHSEDSTCRG